MDAIVDKRFKALSFVWLLFCFLATHLYSENSRLDGLLMQFFMFGVFAAPVWLGYGWNYLYGKRQVSFIFIAIVIALYVAWFHFETNICCGNERGWLVIISGGGFLVIIAPYSKIWETASDCVWKKNRQRVKNMNNKPEDAEQIESNSTPELNPLAKMQQDLVADLRASGFKVKDMEQSNSQQLTATFIPKRK
jgi:hypothetical protein